ncbi:armadillo-type protein [Lipomyces tetrasporus]|uniref:Armadillo-type protein n=1 Tax=Lipomyces tetrasporus TaxID=54092 RepID=A0AAD7QSI4_9ASCO|nr:armadillo-type protein [Lipomyces tetrasporus]KAJ8100486.1 armadillo-type protein [Lipomyces tetrasporus]
MESAALERISDALLTIHNPQVSNGARRQAQEFLDAVRKEDDAPLWGYHLAIHDPPRPDQVRHFGLSLLDHAILQHYAAYDFTRQLALRNWVIELVTAIRPNDAYYIKEKLASLWVAVAKRSWGAEQDEWSDMDEVLVGLWNLNPAARELSITIFRTLFEDVFILDDPLAGKRSGVLSAQCIEILTDDAILQQTYQTRDQAIRSLRFGREGWLIRWSRLLGECLDRGADDSETEGFAIKVLQCLKTCLLWAFPSAIREADLLNRISQALTINNVKVRTWATDCLHILFTRTFSDSEDFKAVIGAVFLPAGIATLSQVYASIKLEIGDLDEDSYILLKKMVEMIVGLGEYLSLSETNKNCLPPEIDLNGYLELVFATTQHESLIISGLSLQFWCSLLRVEELASRPEVGALLPRLLELTAERIIRYERVEEPTATKKFLDIDFDSMPEVHAFLGNYRRFIDDIARLVVCRMPINSLLWLDMRLDKFFSSWHGWHSEGSPAALQKDPQFLVAYAQFSMVDAALRGISRWKSWYQEPDKKTVLVSLNPIIERFCDRMLSMNVTDPVLLRKQIQTLVQFAPLMKDVSQTMFRVLERVLQACTFEYPPNISDEDMELIRDLRNKCSTELNRLAYLMPNALMGIYSDLERIINEIIASNKLSDHEIVSFLSFLLVVSQRSDTPNKAECFAKIVDPVLNSWTDEATMTGLSQLPWFMERVGIVEIANYFRGRGVDAKTDLLATPMDDAGRQLKTRLKDQWAKLFPIRATRIFIQYTIEKLDHSSQDFQRLLALWKPRVQPILPHILQLLSQIEAYNNPENWDNLPLEVRSFVKDSCVERFWQVGISLQSRDEFVEENVKAAQTLRDFADSLGHMLRYTREYAFLALGSITQLESTMYEIPGIGATLWAALAGQPQGITLHAWKHLVAFVVRPVVKNCPPELREAFFPDFLPAVLTQLESVVGSRWEDLTRRGLIGQVEEDDALSEEMMDEYLLRQFSSVVDRLLIDLVGPLTVTGTGTVEVNGDDTALDKSKIDLRTYVLTHPVVLGPFLTLCTRLFTVRDTRCSYSCALMLRQIIPFMIGRYTEVDDYLCDVVIPSCLTILADVYFADVAGEASYVLTMIYTVLRGEYDRPFRKMQEVLRGATPDDIIALERELASVKTLRQQRGVMLEFLAVLRAVPDGPEGEVSRRIARVKKEREKERKNKHSWAVARKVAEQEAAVDNVLEEGGLANLFGNED